MNRRIGRLYLSFAVAFCALIAMTTWWQTWARDGLETRRDNARLVFHRLTIDRGMIQGRRGAQLAANTVVVQNGRRLYFRRYPTGATFAQVVGYSSPDQGLSGLEREYDDYLTGAGGDLSSGLQQLLDRAQGQTVRGNDVVVALDARGQRAAMAGLAATGLAGAVTAFDPRTGKVLVMASQPSYNPNDRAAYPLVLKRPDGPLLVRGTQGLYPPGSTFKMVTAVSALENSVVTTASRFPGVSCITVFQPLCNFHGENPGPHDFRYALVNSINTTFARIGLTLGRQRLAATMQALGFGSKPPIDFPVDQVAASGLYHGSTLQGFGTNWDVARVAIGQANLLATPLQMAMVAGAIANGGVLMRPTFLERVVAPDGHVVQRIQPEQMGRVMSPETAATMTTLMQQVVDEGTGTAAQISGISVAGKTGTAEIDPARGLNDSWFVAFAPARAPTIAIAVVVERTPLTGGQISAPIAKAVIQALRHAPGG